MSIEDDLNLGIPMGRLLNQADALTAVLETSALTARMFVEAFDEADREASQDASSVEGR